MKRGRSHLTLKTLGKRRGERKRESVCMCVGWGERREKGLKFGEGSKPNSFRCTAALVFSADANIVFYYSGGKKKDESYVSPVSCRV